MPRPKRSTVILTSTDEKPWTADGFRSSWRKARAAAGITGLTFNDLRGTAVTRLAVAGCTVPEIATITGHSLRDVGAILDSQLPRPRSGDGRERDPQARKANEIVQLTAQLGKTFCSNQGKN